jgi:hemerythrin-like domain-containing protein
MYAALFFRLFLLQFSSAIDLLYESSLLLQQTDFSDEQEMKSAMNRVTMVADLFDDHAHHEDTYVLPAIQQYEPSIVDAFEQEHTMDAKLTRALKDSLQALQMASLVVRQEMANELSRTFIQFMIFNLEHMSKEENILNKILWRYYSDADILDLQRKIVSSLSPWSAKTGSQWMMRGLNNPEIINWLRAVEDAAPENVFQDLFATAERELPEHRFRKVLETITEGAMLA